MNYLRGAEALSQAEKSVKLKPITEVYQARLSSAAEAHPKAMGHGRGRILIDPEQHRYNVPDIAQSLRHERAHLAPKRNAVHWKQRREASPRAQGREEARASYLAGHRGQYGNPHPRDSAEHAEFQAGFDEVTRRMTRAGTKTQVNKRLSAFGVVW